MLKSLSSSLETILKSQATHERMGKTLANRLTQRWAKNFTRRVLGWKYVEPDDYEAVEKFREECSASAHVSVVPNAFVSIWIDQQTVEESSWDDIENLLYVQSSVAEDLTLVDFLCFDQASRRHSLSDAYDVMPEEAIDVTLEKMKATNGVLNDAELTVSPDVYFAIRQGCKAFKPALTIGHDGYVGVWVSGTEKHRVYTDAMRPRTNRVLDSGTVILSQFSAENQILTVKVPKFTSSGTDRGRRWTFHAPRAIAVDTNSILTTRIYTNARNDS